MYKVAVVAVSVALVSGCASFNKQTIDANTVTSLSNQPISYTVRKKPDFAAMTAGSAAFALVGALAAISTGNGIIEKNNVPDPADAIAIGLANEVVLRHGAKLITPPIPVSSDDPTQIAAATKGAVRFVIDVQTINWSFFYFSSDWTHYRVVYTAKARLIDVETKKVIAEGFCKQIPADNTNAPTYDELLANEAALLKTKLVSAADECTKKIKADMFSL